MLPELLFCCSESEIPHTLGVLTSAPHPKSSRLGELHRALLLVYAVLHPTSLFSSGGSLREPSTRPCVPRGPSRRLARRMHLCSAISVTILLGPSEKRVCFPCVLGGAKPFVCAVTFVLNRCRRDHGQSRNKSHHVARFCMRAWRRPLARKSSKSCNKKRIRAGWPQYTKLKNNDRTLKIVEHSKVRQNQRQDTIIYDCVNHHKDKTRRPCSCNLFCLNEATKPSRHRATSFLGWLNVLFSQSWASALQNVHTKRFCVFA